MYSLPFSSQTRPPLPSRITTSAAKLPKVPPGNTRFDVVFAHELEAAVLADAEHRQTGRDEARPAAVSDRQSRNVRGDEKAPARIDMKIAAVDAARVDVLDDLGFAARRVD